MTAILVVDDDPVARKVIDRLLTSEPRLRDLAPRVLQAPDGQKALAMIARERPALVITDLFMPGMDGFAFCRELRKSPAGQKVPILVVSGVFKDPMLTANLSQEFRAGFLAKPLQASTLADAVLGMVKAATPAPELKAIGSVAVGGFPAASFPTGLSAEMPAAKQQIDASATERGTLAERPVPRILFDHLEAGNTGTIALVRGQMRKEIYLRNGRIVGADSTLRAEALGALLVSQRIIDDNKLQFLLSETKKRRQKMGTVLVELGWMTPDEVLMALAVQARRRIVDCLRWNVGSWGFIPGDGFAGKVMEHPLEGPEIILRGLVRTATPDTLVARFDEDGARPLRIRPRFERFRPAFETAFGATLTPVVLQGGTLGSLVLRDNAQDLMVAVEALLMSGMAELGTPQTQPQPAAPAQAAEPFALEWLGSEVSRQFRAPHLGAQADEMLPDTGGAVAELMQPLDSGVVQLFASPKTQPGVGTLPATDDPEAKLRLDLLREYLELGGKAAHEVLGLGPDPSQEEVSRAYQTKRRRFSPEAIKSIDLGKDASKLEMILTAYERAFQALSNPAPAPASASARPASEPAADALGAELAFNEALSLLQSGKAAEAVKLFERAVTARPDQAAYHAHLGWALFVVGGQGALPAARGWLDHALALDPDLAKAHDLLARLAVSEGAFATARGHLEQALEINPAQPEAVELLVSTLDKLGDARGAERLYRRIIASLGDRALQVRRRLWRELADLYEQKLGDKDSARIAYESAARLSPMDMQAQRKVVELNAEDPKRWREISRALVAEWQQQPTDRASGVALLDVLLKANQSDAAQVAAAALVLRGQADDEIHRLAERGRPRTLTRIGGTMGPRLVRRLAYAGEDEHLEALMSALAEAQVIEPFSAAELGVSAVDALPVARQPQAFREILQYVAGFLAVPPPPAIHVHPELIGDARMADVRPYALLVGPSLLEARDPVELAFRLGRALALRMPGRIAGSARSGRQLRPYFLASVAMARGSPKVADPEADAVYRRLVTQDRAVRVRLVELGQRLIRTRPTVNLGLWARALTRTATRVGLVLSGDLVRVGRAVAEEEGPEALDDLLAFSLSLDHLDLRAELGLAGAR